MMYTITHLASLTDMRGRMGYRGGDRKQHAKVYRLNSGLSTRPAATLMYLVLDRPVLAAPKVDGAPIPMH